jgi:hypothetical protein
MGNDRQNPVPVQTVVDAINIVVSSSWLKLANYDEMQTSLVGFTTSLIFKESGNTIGLAEIYFEGPENWNVLLKRYLNDDGGALLLDDDGTPLTLD